MSRTLPDIDDRARRTRNRIAHAVIALAVRDGLDTVTVAQLVKEAGIGRSTFYAHYTGIADYLTRSFAWILERGAQMSALRPGAEAQILPVHAILHHIAGNRPYVAATIASRYRPAMFAAGEQALRQVCSANLKRLRPTLLETERQLLATFVAGGFIAILRAWMTGGMSEPPDQVQRRFERLCDALIDPVPARERPSAAA